MLPVRKQSVYNNVMSDTFYDNEGSIQLTPGLQDI